MSEIKWHPTERFGNPEYSGLYLVTTKTTGAVVVRYYNDYKGKWNFGTPLAWAYLPEPYEEEPT